MEALVASPRPVLRATLEALLTSVGFRPTSVTRARELRADLRRRPPALVILDAEPNDQDPLELAWEIRRIRRYRKTDALRPQDHVAILAARIHAVIPNPIPTQRLRAILRRMRTERCDTSA